MSKSQQNREYQLLFNHQFMKSYIFSIIFSQNVMFNNNYDMPESNLIKILISSCNLELNIYQLNCMRMKRSSIRAGVGIYIIIIFDSD